MSTDVTPIQWSTLTAEQRNQLISEKVMGQNLLCNGKLTYGATDAILGGRVYVCLECNALVTVHQEQSALPELHVRSVPNYSQSLDAIKQLRQHMFQRFPVLNLHIISYSYNRCYATFTPGMAAESDLWSEGNGEHCMEDAICIAALRACGVEVEA